MARSSLADTFAASDRVGAALRARIPFSTNPEFMEQVYDGVADIEVLACTNFDRSVPCAHTITISLPDGRQLPLKAENVDFLRSASAVPVHGVILNSVFYLRSEVARCVERSDADFLVAQGKLKPSSDVSEVACYVGSSLQWYPSPSHAHSEGKARRGRSLRPNDPTWAVGDKTALVVLMSNGALTWSDVPASMAKVKTNVDKGFAWLQQMSYDKFKTTITYAPVVYDVSATFSGTKCDDGTSQVIAAVEGHPTNSYTVSSFSRILIVCPGFSGTPYAGLAQVPGTRSWYNGDGGTAAGVTAHEIGHNIGLNHASFGTSGYGDKLDCMGSGATQVGDFKALYKHSCFWIPQARIATLALYGATAACASCSSAGEFTLAAFDQSAPAAAATDEMQTIRVDMGRANTPEFVTTTTDSGAATTLYPSNEFLEISVRSRIAGVAGKVGLSIVPVSNNNVGTSQLQDTTPGTGSLYDSAIPVGSAYIFQGNANNPALAGWYTGPRVLVQPLSSTFPAGWAATKGVNEAPYNVRVRVTFLDRDNNPMYGLGCTVGSGCQQGLAQRLSSATAIPVGTPSTQTGTVSATQPALFKITVTQPRLVSIDTCVAGTAATLNASLGIYTARDAPVTVVAYGASVSSGAMQFAEPPASKPAWAASSSSLTQTGCTKPHASLSFVALAPENSPYYVVVKPALPPAAAGAAASTSGAFAASVTWQTAITASTCNRITAWNGRQWERTGYEYNGAEVWTTGTYFMVQCSSTQWYVRKSAACSGGFYFRATVSATAPATIAGATCYCPAGTKAVDSAKTGCTPCAAGKTSAPDSTTCSCAAGSTGSGSTCTPCAANRYTDTTGACVACPTGSTSPAGSDWAGACTCPAGKQPVSGSCASCPVGYFKAASGNHVCDVCPPGFTTSGSGSAAATDCSVVIPVATPAGSYSVCPSVYITRSGSSSYGNGLYDLGGIYYGRPYYKRVGGSQILSYSEKGWNKFVLASTVGAGGAYTSFTTLSKYPQDNSQIQCVCAPGDPVQMARGTCRCPAGYADVNGVCECTNCAPKSACTGNQIPVPGSSTTCGCPPGFTDNGGTCVDVNECPTLGAATCTAPGQTCVNTPGSWTCSCPPGQGGFQADPSVCQTCPQDSYSPDTGGCIKCPNGTQVSAAVWQAGTATAQSQCQCKEGLIPDAAGAGCSVPAVLALGGGSVQTELNGCYQPDPSGARSHGELLYKKQGGGSAVYLAYVPRNSGEWVALGNPSDTESRFAVAEHSRFLATPVGTKMQVYSASLGRFTADAALTVSGGTNCAAAIAAASGGAKPTGADAGATVGLAIGGTLIALALIGAAAMVGFRQMKARQSGGSSSSSTFTPGSASTPTQLSSQGATTSGINIQMQAAPAAVPAAAPAGGALPAGWTQAADESGRVYYYNAATQQSTWERPAY